MSNILEKEFHVPDLFVGAVSNCVKLNIREEPSIDSRVRCVVDFASELLIDTSKSTLDWFSVCTPAGIEGYCMKRYVNIGTLTVASHQEEIVIGEEEIEDGEHTDLD
jgi:hypothetical protein